MNNKKGRYFLIGTKQSGLSGGQSPETTNEGIAGIQLTKDKAIDMINDELPSEIKDKLLKIFKQIDPKQAKGIAQLGEDAYIKTMIELTSRPIYADDGKVGAELKGSGKEDFVKQGKKQDTIDDEEEVPDEEPDDPYYDDKLIDDEEYYEIRKERAKQSDYAWGTAMYRVVNKIIKEDHKGLKSASNYDGQRENTKKFYDTVERIIEDQYEKIEPSKKKQIIKTEKKRIGLETDEQKKMYDNLIDLVMDQVKDTELNVKYVISRINTDPYVSDVILRLASLQHLLDPYTKEGDNARTDVWKEQKKVKSNLVDDSNAYYNEIMFRNELIKQGYKDVKATTELDLLFESDKMCKYDIIGDDIIGDVKGNYYGGNLIDDTKLLDLLKLSKSLKKPTLIIGWPPHISEDATLKLRRANKDQTDFTIFKITSKDDKAKLTKWLKGKRTEDEKDYLDLLGFRIRMGYIRQQGKVMIKDNNKPKTVFKFEKLPKV